MHALDLRDERPDVRRRVDARRRRARERQHETDQAEADGRATAGRTA